MMGRQLLITFCSTLYTWQTIRQLLAVLNHPYTGVSCILLRLTSDSTTCLVNFIHPNKLSSSRSHCSFSIGVQKMIWLGFRLVAFQIWKNWKLARVKCISQVYNIACHFQQQFEVPNIELFYSGIKKI